MLVSELIAQLETAKAAHGDIPVYATIYSYHACMLETNLKIRFTESSPAEIQYGYPEGVYLEITELE